MKTDDTAHALLDCEAQVELQVQYAASVSSQMEVPPMNAA